MGDGFETVTSEAAKQDLQDRIGRAESLLMVYHSEGWKFVQAYVEGKVKDFSTKAINKGFSSEKENEFERGKVKGLIDLLGSIEADLIFLNEQRNTGPTGQQ